MPTLTKIFRPVTRNTVIFYLALSGSLTTIFAVPSSKKSKVVDDDFDDDDPWNDDIEQLKRPVSILGAQKQKSKSPAKDVPDLPGSPDRHLMERILQHRNKHNVRELQLDPQVDRQQSLVNGNK